jgi:succinoglycan biosynthesis transport protein ExoP
MSRFAEALQKRDHELPWWQDNAERVLPESRLGPVSALPPSQSAPDAGAAKIEWLQALAAVRKYWRSSAMFAACVMTTVVLVTMLSKPVYEPTARVEIDPQGGELFSLEGGRITESSADYMETQARNMQSDELLISVVRQLHLDAVAEFTEQSFLSRVVSGTASMIETLPLRIWGKSSSRTAEGSSGPQPLSPREASALGTLQSQLSVKRDTASRLVSVSFAGHDPVLSANVTNTVVRSFIDHSYQTRHDAIMESTDWLSRQLDDIRARMEESNRALAAYQGSKGIADIDQNRSTYSEQMAELSRQKTQAQAERIQIESYLLRVRRTNPASLPQIQNSQVVQMLTQKLGESRAELSQTLAIYGDNHPNVKKLRNQIQELESQIQLQNQAIIGQMETSYAAALAREQMIDAQLRGTTRELSQMARYAELKKDAQTNADLYNSLYARIKEAGIIAASKSINIRIIDKARVLSSPTKPRPLLNFALGLFVALTGGVLLAFVRQAADTRIHTLEDMRGLIGSSAMSVVPIAEGNGRFSNRSLTSVFGGAQKALEGPVNFLVSEPDSEQSEAFRAIHTSVMLSQPGQPPHLLLVASSVPGEGKTTVAINLAVALAQQGKTCILDADLRRPSIGRALHITQEAGLGDYLTDSIPLDGILTPAPGITSLTVLAAGKTTSDPGRLISSENMRILLHQLRELYDFVVIDSPPILPYADGRALAPFVDGIVFVGRAGFITRAAMARSMELLQEIHSAPILEVVLNGTSTGSPSYGYGYNYKYRYPPAA